MVFYSGICAHRIQASVRGHALRPAALPFAIFACVLGTEVAFGPAEDHAWHFGLAALRRFKDIDWNTVRDGLFGWLVKGFFLHLILSARGLGLKNFAARRLPF